MTTPPPRPPYPRAVEADTEPGIGIISLKQENARLMADNIRLRGERNAAHAALAQASAPTWRKVISLGTAVGVGTGVCLFVLLRLALRAVFDRWPHLGDAVLGALGGR